MTITLRQYQLSACAAAERAWATGTRRVLLNLATGLGKTVIFAELIRRDQERGGRRSLVLAHRDELLEQAAQKIRLVHPRASIGFVRQKQNEIDREVVIASVQTIATEGRLTTLPVDFSLVVVDEAHHAVAPYHMKILTHTGALKDHSEAPRLLGVTATPQRADNVGLSNVFQKLVFRMGILDGIINGYLCDLRVESVRVRVDLSRVAEKKSGDYQDGALGEALMAADAPEEIVAAYRQSAMGRKAICFTPTIEMAKAVSSTFNSVGVMADWLSGTTSTTRRRNILERLQSGELQVVANAAVLTEGFDCPSVECIINARPTRSKTLYIQLIGRGVRPSPSTGKKDCLVLDVAGASSEHRLVTLADITGLPASVLEKKSVLEATRTEIVDVPTPDDAPRPTGTIERHRAANQFTEFSWTKLTGQFEKFYALALSDGGFLYVMPTTGEKYDVLHHDRSTKDAAEGYMQAVAENLPLDYAMGLAEDRVRDLRAMRLNVSTAPWRSCPATPRQREYLRKNQISAPEALTKGAAADLINAHIAQATLDRLMRLHAQ